MYSDATISRCGRYRYMLRRVWDSSRPLVCFICCNPSTADATHDDPTVRRLIGYARDWGYGGLVLVNLYAWRATKPSDIYKQTDPVGPDNDSTIQLAALLAARVVVAWGAFGAHLNRDRQVAELLRSAGVEPYAIAVNADGSPGHPLYLRKALEPQPWSMPERATL